MDYKIENIKCALSEGGFANGSVSGNTNVSIQYNDGTKSQWLNLVECLGIPSFYQTDNDIFDELVKDEFNEESQGILDNSYITEFDGIALGENYDVSFADIRGNEEKASAKLILLLIQLAHCEIEKEQGIIEAALGKMASEIEIPETLESDVLW